MIAQPTRHQNANDRLCELKPKKLNQLVAGRKRNAKKQLMTETFKRL